MPTRVCIANLLQANPTAPTGRLEMNSWQAYRGNKNNNELYESLVCYSSGQEPITPAQAQCLTNWADKERLRARLTFEKQLGDGPLEKLWGGGGEFFFCTSPPPPPISFLMVRPLEKLTKLFKTFSALAGTCK